MKCKLWKDRICAVRNLPCEVVKDCPEYQDLTPEEIVRKANELIRGGTTIWIKFTCRHCGSRQTSDTPNALHTGGYTCEECGKLSYPIRFGFILETRVEGGEFEEKIIKAPKEVEVLVVGKDFIEALAAFNYVDLRYCPDDRLINFCIKHRYDDDEKRVLKLIPNVDNAVEMRCPTVCSGIRGDGTRFRDGCMNFIGYGINNDEVFDFSNPQLYVNCERHGEVRIEKFTSDCKIRKLAVAVARSRGLIEHVGSAALGYVSRKTCLKCDYYNKELDNCNFKVGCKKGEGLVFMFTDCTYGDCESCPRR